MKKLCILFFSLLTVISINCKKEEIKPGKETGTLTIDIGFLIREYKVNQGLKAVPLIEDFKVIICSSDGSEVMVFETSSSMPESIEMTPGNYYVVAHSDNDLPASFENPYYYGISEVFTISSNQQQTIQVNCRLANTIVSVVYSDALKSSFIDYSTTVSSSLGSLIFTRDEIRWGYFHALPLDIKVELTCLDFDGTETSRILSGKIAEPIPGSHYEIFVNTLIQKGTVSFQLLLDDTEIPVEIIEINTENENEEPDESIIGYGGLLITEIMFDPTALSDSEGEWYEIYNNSGRTLNLKNLVLTRDQTNRHTIKEFIELLPGEYFVLARTATATDVINRYIYGTAILMPNTGATLSIFNEDKDMEAGTLIYSVNYGGSNFPSPAGASIILSPDRMNSAEAVSGTSWCVSSSVYHTGDKGTPGKVNDLCW